MSRQVVVVEPGRGDRVGNVELLARTVDTPFFNLAVVVLAPGQGVDGHVHRGEDDSWLVLEGTLTVTVGDERRVLHAGPGTYVLVPEGTYHALANEGPDDVRFLNVHAPGGFDRRIGWRPRRTGVLATVLALVVAVLLAAGGPASAAAFTKAKVQQIAAPVVQQQAPKLSVARAGCRRCPAAARIVPIEPVTRTRPTGPSRPTNAKSAGRTEPGRLPRPGRLQPWCARGDDGRQRPRPDRSRRRLVEVPAGVEFVRLTGVAAFAGGNRLGDASGRPWRDLPGHGSIPR